MDTLFTVACGYYPATTLPPRRTIGMTARQA